MRRRTFQYEKRGRVLLNIYLVDNMGPDSNIQMFNVPPTIGIAEAVIDPLETICKRRMMCAATLATVTQILS